MTYNDKMVIPTAGINSSSSFIIGKGTGSIYPETSSIISSGTLVASRITADHIEGYVSKDELDEILRNLSKNPLYQHKCVSCGGTVELDYDKAIFICPYCGSHYALNTERINDKG